MQEEETKETMKKPLPIDLPELEEVPVFMDMPLITTDDSGITRINVKPAFALIASLTLTIKDVYRFSSELVLGVDSDDPGEQELQMVDCRTADTRSVYKMAILEFIFEYLPKTWMEEYCIPAAHLATVLLQLFKDREAMWKSYPHKIKNAKAISNPDKEKALALVLNATKLGDYLNRGKEPPIKEEDRIFMVAFPGYVVRDVPATRNHFINEAAKKKKTCADQSWSAVQQKTLKKTI